MATTLTLTPYDGYPTETAMRVWVEFEVTYSATYYTYFELYDEDDNLVKEAKGATYTLDAGDTKDGIYKTFTGLDPGTSYYIVGSLWNDTTGKRLSIDEPVVYFTTESSRPSDWSWTSTVNKGSTLKLTATEWLNFLNRVKAFYEYKNKTVDSTYWSKAVNGVSTGLPMTSTQANGARYLIAQLSPPTAVPAEVSSGITITAAFINGLKNSLNSIK